jgi:hypothetical protein
VTVKLEWNGDAVERAVVRAAAHATVAIVDECVVEARHNTPVLTGAARDSLEREGEGLDVAWGYHVADERGRDRGIWIEIGANGKTGHHALRRAADTHYPRLAGRIARSLAGV